MGRLLADYRHRAVNGTDAFAGSYPTTALMDENITDGVAIIQQNGTITVADSLDVLAVRR